VRDLDVIAEPATALAMLEPTRAKILATLAEPGSATTVANAIGLSRQKVNYHLRTLESHGLVRLFEERPRRGLTERVMIASARSYVVSPSALGENAPDPSRTDRLSATYLIALAARLVREVADLARRAERADKQLATLALDTEIRFENAAARAGFAGDLADAVTNLVARYHNENAQGGSWYRVVVAAHPRPGDVPPTNKES